MTTSAHWSSMMTLAQAGLLQERGLVLGSRWGQLVRDDGPEHVLLVGKTQLGRKTSSFVVPNLLSWRHSVLVTDPKGELYPLTAGWRARVSRVLHLTPSRSMSDRYNLLGAIPLRTEQEVRAVQLVSEMLADPDGRGTDHMTGATRHFTGLAKIGLTGLILYGLYTQRARSLGGLRAMYMQTSLVEHGRAMQRYPHPLIQEAGKVLCEVNGQEEASGFFSTVALALWVYSDPLIQRATDHSDFTLEDLREGVRPMSLYVGVPFGDQERLRPWVRTVVHQLTDYCVSKKDGWAWKMLGLFEETPSLGRLRFVHEGLNYAAGYGFRICIITPTLNELVATFGRNHHFLEGCGIKLMYGVGDGEVAEIYSRDLGERRRWHRRFTGAQWGGEWGKEPLLSPTALMDLPPSKALIMAGQVKVVVRKAYYKAYPVWKARSELAAA
jgi:type IV secretion system protein VirD4